ncbi:MAG TPA: amidohydrolase family protein [Gemmataceae bacterium]|nr:amidohydrolase family protein [Gemmataceae bacterium]
MRIAARHYATGALVQLTCENGLIRSVEAPTESPADLRAGWVAPAFFDLQINGCGGLSFSSAGLTEDQIRRIVRTGRQHGIAGFCPTFVTNAIPALLHSFGVGRHACESDAEIAGAMPVFHLEGPYISAEDGPRGAHARQHVHPPDWDEFRRLQDAAGGRIGLVTLAPELEGALPFIERLVDAGIVVAIGHTAATGARIREAIASGARLSTHLGNGSHALLPRHDNYIWEQLAADELWASIIPDGHHLPPAVIRCIVRVKTPARTIITCDASSLAGLPPGRYQEWDQELLVLPGGKIVVAESGYLAGSSSFTDECIGHMVRCAGVTLGDAVDMAGARPRELLGLPARKLEPGYPADLVIFEWNAEGGFKLGAALIGGTLHQKCGEMKSTAEQ